MRIAVVDIGTNSTRLLVCDVDDGAVSELDRESIVTRLGEGVDSSGRLTEAAGERVMKVLADYRRRIDDQGADHVVAVATSAVRDSANAGEFRAAIRERFDVDVRTISGDEEARLTFLGATSRRDPSSGPALVLDIGGGSTELVVGRPGADPDFHVSARAGSVRQTERHLHDDPPTDPQLESLRDEVAAIICDAVPAAVREPVDQGIAVAGTVTSLAAVDQALDPYDRERVDGYILSRPACERMLAELASIPLSRRREVTGLHPDRAPTIVAGAAILVEAMRAFAVDAMETSEADILHGAAISLASTRSGYA